MVIESYCVDCATRSGGVWNETHTISWGNCGYCGTFCGISEYGGWTWNGHAKEEPEVLKYMYKVARFDEGVPDIERVEIEREHKGMVKYRGKWTRKRSDQRDNFFATFPAAKQFIVGYLGVLCADANAVVLSRDKNLADAMDLEEL